MNNDTRPLLSPEPDRAADDIKAQIQRLEEAMAAQQQAEREIVQDYEPSEEKAYPWRPSIGRQINPVEMERLRRELYRPITLAGGSLEVDQIPAPWEPRNGRYWFNELDERQRKEIALAQVYASDYNHGTAGHTRLMLMDYMAATLDRYEERLARGTGPGLVDPFTARQVLGVRYNPQWGYDANAHKKDCGPACLEMLGEYHNQGVDRTTDEIMRYITGGADRPTGIAELRRAASELYGITLKRYNGATVHDLVKWIDAGRPAMVLIWYGGYELRLDRGFTGGHYWVVVGYERFHFEGQTWLRFIIHDPDYYGARHVVSGAFMPVTMEQFGYVWDNAHRAWNNPDNVALVKE